MRSAAPTRGHDRDTVQVVVSPHLDGLVRDPVQRTYLTTVDGFWADSVLDAFQFLENLGYRIELVRFHQEGDLVLYRGPRGKIGFELFPAGQDINAEVSLDGGARSFVGELDGLARELDPMVEFPAKLPLAPETIAANVRFWANLLRSAAHEIL